MDTETADVRGAAITALSNEERDQGPTSHVEPLPDQGPAVTMNVQPNEVAQTDQIHEGQIIQKIRNLLKDCQLYEEAQQDALKKNAKEEMKKHISKIEYKYETGNKEWARYLTVAFAYSNSPLTIEEALKLSKVYEVRTLGPGNKIFQCRGDRCNIRNHKNIRGIDNLLDHWEYYCKHQKCTDLGNQQNEREDEEEDEPSMRRHTRGRRNSGQGLPGEGQDTPPNYGGSDTESQETDEDETHPESVTLSDEKRQLMRESIVRFREKKVMSTVEGVSRNEWYVYWRQKGGMTRAEFRKKHGKHIFKDGHDMMVGHIIAQSNGGADHPDNYLPLGREINISMQDTSDQFMCFLAGRKRAKRAMQISSELGNMSFKAGNGKDRYPGQKYFKVSTLDGEDADIYFGTGETCCAPAIKKLKSHNQRKRQQYEREQKDDSDDSD